MDNISLTYGDKENHEKNQTQVNPAEIKQRPMFPPPGPGPMPPHRPPGPGPWPPPPHHGPWPPPPPWPPHHGPWPPPPPPYRPWPPPPPPPYGPWPGPPGPWPRPFRPGRRPGRLWDGSSLENDDYEIDETNADSESFEDEANTDLIGFGYPWYPSYPWYGYEFGPWYGRPHRLPFLPFFWL